MGIGVVLAAEGQRVEAHDVVGRPDHQAVALGHDLHPDGQQRTTDGACPDSTDYVGEAKENLPLVGVEAGGPVHLVDGVVELVAGGD